VRHRLELEVALRARRRKGVERRLGVGERRVAAGALDLPVLAEQRVVGVLVVVELRGGGERALVVALLAAVALLTAVLVEVAGGARRGRTEEGGSPRLPGDHLEQRGGGDSPLLVALEAVDLAVLAEQRPADPGVVEAFGPALAPRDQLKRDAL